MMFNMTDAILARDAPEGAAAILNAMLWSCTNKLTSMVTVQSALLARIEQKNDSEPPLDVTFISTAQEFRLKEGGCQAGKIWYCCLYASSASS